MIISHESSTCTAHNMHNIYALTNLYICRIKCIFTRAIKVAVNWCCNAIKSHSLPLIESRVHRKNKLFSLLPDKIQVSSKLDKEGEKREVHWNNCSYRHHHNIEGKCDFTGIKQEVHNPSLCNSTQNFVALAVLLQTLYHKAPGRNCI